MREAVRQARAEPKEQYQNLIPLPLPLNSPPCTVEHGAWTTRLGGGIMKT